MAYSRRKRPEGLEIEIISQEDTFITDIKATTVNICMRNIAGESF